MQTIVFVGDGKKIVNMMNTVRQYFDINSYKINILDIADISPPQIEMLKKIENAIFIRIISIGARVDPNGDGGKAVRFKNIFGIDRILIIILWDQSVTSFGKDEGKKMILQKLNINDNDQFIHSVTIVDPKDDFLKILRDPKELVDDILKRIKSLNLTILLNKISEIQLLKERIITIIKSIKID